MLLTLPLTFAKELVWFYPRMAQPRGRNGSSWSRILSRTRLKIRNHQIEYVLEQWGQHCTWVVLGSHPAHLSPHSQCPDKSRWQGQRLAPGGCFRFVCFFNINQSRFIYFLKYFIDYAIIVVSVFAPLPTSTQHPLSLRQSHTIVHVHGSYV